MIAQSNSDTNVEIPRKRARRKGKNSRQSPTRSLVRRKGGKIGKIAGLLEIPVDIFCEVRFPKNAAVTC